MYKYEKEILEAQLGRENEVLKELQREYEAALKQINEKIMILQADPLTQSRIYQLQYQHALKAQVEAILEKLHADEYSTIQQYLSDSYSDSFISTMYCFHKQDVPLILPIDKKAAVRAVLTDSKIKGSLYAALGINVKAMKKSISQEITRGIASGLSYSDIIRNLRNATKAPYANAKTIVRTEGHRIQQASAEDARQLAKEKGADVVKQWDATMDSSTRPTHQRLDGQIQETHEPFRHGTKEAMYPGDFGDPAEDCNCRCVALTRARWALDEDELEELKARAEYFGLDKTKDFEDFKAKYISALEDEEETTFWNLKGGNTGIDYKIALTNRFEEGNETAKAVYSKYVPPGGAVVGKKDGKGSHIEGKVYVDFDADAVNVRGAGTTYFHEHGHYVDYKVGRVSHSAEYLEAMKRDVNSLYAATGEKKKRDAEYAIMQMLTKPDIIDKANGVSDIVYGLTNGKTGGAWSHKKSYYHGYALQHEAFAHMFEASFSAEKQALMKNYFPQAWEVFMKLMEGLL